MPTIYTLITSDTYTFAPIAGTALVYAGTGTGTTPGGTYTPSGDESGVYTSATSTMPAQINALGQRSNTTQPLEFQNPTTLVWVTGTVTSTAGGNEFAATLTGVAAGTYAPGTLKMRVVGLPTLYYNEAPVTVTASTGGGTSPAVTLTPTTADRAHNSTIADPAGALTRYAAFDALNDDTTADSVVVSAISTYPYGAPNPATFSAFVNDVFVQTVIVTADGVEHDYPITLPTGNGTTRRLRLVEGGQQRTNEQGNILATTITKLTHPAGTTAALARPTYPSGICDDGDSLTNNATTAVPERQGMMAYRSATQSIFVPGYGSREALATIGTNALRQAYLPRIQSYFASISGSRKYVFRLGVNDLIRQSVSGIAPGDLIAPIVAWLNLLKASVSGIEIYGVTLLHFQDEETRFAYPRSAWNTALTSAYNQAGVVVIDGGTLDDGSQRNDYIHRNEAGYATIASNLYAAVGGVVAQVDPETLPWEDVVWVGNSTVTTPSSGVVQQATASDTFQAGAYATKQHRTQAGQSFVSDLEITVLHPDLQHVFGLIQAVSGPTYIQDSEIDVRCYPSPAGRVRVWHNVASSTTPVVDADYNTTVAVGDIFRFRTYQNRVEVSHNGVLKATYTRASNDARFFSPQGVFGNTNLSIADQLYARQRGVNLVTANV